MNLRNVIMVEKNLKQYKTSVVRLTEDFPATLRLITKQFEFDKGQMLTHAADLGKPEADRKYMIPVYCTKHKAPTLREDEPWSTPRGIEAAQKGLLRKCHACWKNTEHLRVS